MQIKFLKHSKQNHYFVSDTGMILSIKILKPKKSKKNKYPKVQIGKKAYYVHRLVYWLFGKDLTNFDSKEVDHIDGDPENNCIENLDLVTHAENIIRRDNKNIPF